MSQLKRLDMYIEKRNNNFKKFINLVSQYEHLFYVPEINDKCSNFCFPLICKDKNLTIRLKKIFDENGIEHRPIISGNLLKQPFLSNYTITSNKQKLNIDTIHDNGIYLGNNQFVGNMEINLLSKIIK